MGGSERQARVATRKRKAEPTVAIRTVRPPDGHNGGEMSLTGAVVDLLLHLGCLAQRINSGAIVASDGAGGEFMVKLAERGTSDVLGVLPPSGRAIAVETKVWPKKPTVSQVRYLLRQRAAGGIGVLAYSMNDVARVLIAEGVLSVEQWPDLPPPPVEHWPTLEELDRYGV